MTAERKLNDRIPELLLKYPPPPGTPELDDILTVAVQEFSLEESEVEASRLCLVPSPTPARLLTPSHLRGGPFRSEVATQTETRLEHTTKDKTFFKPKYRKVVAKPVPAHPEQDTIMLSGKFSVGTRITLTVIFRSSRPTRRNARLEDRPKWGVNKPSTRYIKASDRYPFIRNRNDTDDSRQVPIGTIVPTPRLDFHGVNLSK